MNLMEAMHPIADIDNCGLGLRHEFWGSLIELKPQPVDFLEVAPENWMGIGGPQSKTI